MASMFIKDETNAVSLTIKNTFVDLDADETTLCPPRRCTSAPSSPRGKAALAELCMDRFRPLVSKKQSSDGSTLCSDDSDVDACSSHAADGSAQSVKSAETTPAVVEPPMPTVTRTPLRSMLKAKAWTPPNDRDIHMRKAMDTIQNRLNRVRSLVNMNTEWRTPPSASGGTPATAGMCTLTIIVAMEACQPVEQVLTAAKQAILTTIAEVPSLCVMGQKASPFVATSQGFAVMVGAMEDPSMACWDAYGKGFCSRGNSCHWKHPTTMTHVNVNVVTVQTSAAETMYMAVPVQMDAYDGQMAMQGFYQADGMMMYDEYGNTVVAQGYSGGYY